MEYYSALKENEIMPFDICSNTDGLRDDHTKWNNQEEKDKYHDITYMWNHSMTQMSLSMKETHRHKEQTCGYQGRERWGRDRLGVWK